MRGLTIFSVLLVLLAGLTFSGSGTAAGSDVAGTWRVLSSRLFYDQGGGGPIGAPVSTPLLLRAEGTWEYGSSSGRYEVVGISAQDWARWGVSPYGPKRRIVLSGWNRGTADGPIEEGAAGVDFVWVIYRVGPPTVGAPGTVWLKFGRSR